MLALIQFHFERHRIDPWSLLLIAGLVMLAASLIGYVLRKEAARTLRIAGGCEAREF
jgi:hypothetical protein